MPRISTITLLTVVLAAASVLPLGAPVAVRAGTDSDIPGIPLPNPVVSGPLGGPIYDVVYRIDVPAGYVLVAGLTGTAGTDFDLYLFDASATTVVATTGLLTKSIGPASSEQIAWPTRIGGTFYLDLNGASAVEGTYILSLQVVPDPTPPVARLLVAGGLTSVNSPNITLQLIGFDDLSGVTDMSLSADGMNFLPAVPMQSQFPWILSDGDGPKTVWARVVNGVGLVSAPVPVTVTLDTTGPTVTTISPIVNSIVSAARPLISERFSEPIDPSSWTTLGLLVQAPSGGILPGTYAYAATTNTGTFAPAEDLAPGYIYIVTLGDVRDVVGNRAQVTGSWTIKRLLPAALTIGASPAVVVYGGAVRLSGSAVVPAGEQVDLASKPGAATAYAPVSTFPPASGRYGLSVTPAMNTWYQVSYAGSPTTMSASAQVRVLVRRKVAVLGPGPSRVRTAAAGHRLTITAQVGPAGSIPVSFRIYRYDTARGRYVYVRSFSRTSDLLGRATLTWKPSAGRFAWRISAASSVDYANNMTPAYRWSVRG